MSKDDITKAASIGALELGNQVHDLKPLEEMEKKL